MPKARRGSVASRGGPSQSEKSPASGGGFHIVGIGASSGGLEAFVALFKNLATNTGMAFVVIQHLDPTRENKLPEMLARATRMPVSAATNDMKVEPDRVYVIPYNKQITIVDGHLKLLRRGDNHMLIDNFFCALAKDQGKCAIGVILSGTGNDGTLGLEAIKASSGIAFASDEASARFSAMPASAIATGLVDFTLAPDKIAAELNRIARRKPMADDDEITEDFKGIIHLLHEQTKVDFSHYKTTTVRRRIMRRMVLKGKDSEKAYLHSMANNPDEVQALFDDILINVTRFFRDARTFDLLQAKIFPAILKTKSADTPVRIWVPGCSTGEEVYSIAILLTELLARQKRHQAKFQIYGTDLSERTIRMARAGQYSKSIEGDVSPARLRTYFIQREGGYQIHKVIRERCTFARHDITTDPPFPRIDLISCRNLLIYFDKELQKRVLPILHFSLNPGGFLLLGSSEGVATSAGLFSVSNQLHKIYVKKTSRLRTQFTFLPQRNSPLYVEPVSAASTAGETGVRKYGDTILLKKLNLCGVLIDSEMRILQFRGKTGLFLEHATGEATLDLMKMVHPDLLGTVRQVVKESMASKTSVKKESARYDGQGNRHNVTIEVIPFRPPPGREYFFHVLFQAWVVTDRPPQKPHALDPGLTNSQRIEQEKEFVERRQALEALLEDKELANEALRTANEEIQMANEEIQAVNEEMQTSNEELETAKEELQSSNEELNIRNVELTRLNNDLNNLFQGIDIPILILSEDLRLRSSSPQADSLFHLKKSGPEPHLQSLNLDIPGIDKLAGHVLHSRKGLEREIQHVNGHHYSVRIQPYLTPEHESDGLVIFFINIDQIKKTEQVSQELNRVLGIRARQQEAIAKLSQQALEGRNIRLLLEDTIRVVHQLLSVKHVMILEALPKKKVFVMRHGAGWQDGFVGKAEHPAERYTPEGLALLSNAPVIVEDSRSDTRFRGTVLHHEHNLVSEVCVVISGRPLPYGVLAVCSPKPDRFNGGDVSFLQALANIVATSIEHRRLESDLLEVSSAEQRRIGQDIHDGLGQQLAGIKFVAELAARNMSPKVGIKKEMGQITKAIHEAILQSRRLARGLSPVDVESNGLMAALKELTENTAKLFRIDCEFHCQPPALIHDNASATHLYRIAQEAIQNAVKHGRATRVRVALTKASLTILDNGLGVSTGPQISQGMGLRIMHYRARTIGGSLTVKPAPKRGTKVICTFKNIHENSNQTKSNS